MKRLLFAFILLTVSTLAGAQQRFTCNFRITEKESGEEVASGVAYVQDRCYRCDTENGALYCNGTDRWIYSSASNELVIQQNDLSMFEGLDIGGIKGDHCEYEYSGFKVSLTNIKKVAEPWSATFFIIDPQIFNDDTVITDLR